MNQHRVPDPVSTPTATIKWTFLFGFLAVLAVLDTFHDYLSRQVEGTPVGVAMHLEWGFFFYAPYFVLVPAAVFFMDKYRLRFERPGSFVIHAIAGLVFTYLHVAIYTLPSPPPAAAFDPDYRVRFVQVLRVDFAIAYSIYFTIVVSTYLVQHYAELKEGEMRSARLEANLAQTRLRAIEAQLNPHFFFNTLQAISVLALAGERTAVAEMLGRLSNLLRVMFDKKRPALIPLAMELDFINGYLDIHRLSFDDRLKVVQEIQPETLKATVPAMLLQPLVENSIVHGLSVKPGHGTIRICARRTVDGLVIEVDDSGPGFPTSEPSRRGVGLSATESRLKLLFGADYSIAYGRSHLGGAHIRVALPFRLAPQLPPILTSSAAA